MTGYRNLPAINHGGWHSATILPCFSALRRFTRLTNGFSKKAENHAAAAAIHFIDYNFARIHKSLRITPAMAAGLSDHVWSLEEIARLTE